MSKKSELEFKVLELNRYKRRGTGLKAAFLRPAYNHTSAECKDYSQLKLHEFDWMK